MEIRYKVRRKQLLEEAKIVPEVQAKVLERLPCFLEPYLECVERREQKEHLQRYVQGLLSDVERKNVETIAYLHNQGRRELQRFIGESSWKHEPMLKRLAEEVGQELGEPDGVLVIDPSGFKKFGQNSVGVQRQWLGRLGKVDNGQVGVYLGYVSRKGQALIDERLYLPQEWAKDRKRRRKSGIPEEVRFQTRHELAQAMIKERGGLLPHRWISGDDEMGRCSRFREWLRNQQEQYLLATPSNTQVRDLEGVAPPWCGRGRKPKAPWQSARAWLQKVSEEAWRRIDVRDGEKDLLIVEAIKCRVQGRKTKSRPGPEELLFVTRVKERGGWKIDYYLSNASAETSLEELARVAKAEHRIEECFKNAKSEAGLADYEVRTWQGWHHHQTIAMISAWFLTREARRGKKMDASHNDTPGTQLDSHAFARGINAEKSWLGVSSYSA